MGCHNFPEGNIMQQQEILDWMQEGTDFDTLWNAWQAGTINYLQFAKAIQELDDVPEEVKKNHMNSANLVMEEMNKALYLYSTMKQQCPDSFERIMQNYNSKDRYSIVTGVQRGHAENKTYH